MQALRAMASAEVRRGAQTSALFFCCVFKKFFLLAVGAVGVLGVNIRDELAHVPGVR
jgi:hypothetical protein